MPEKYSTPSLIRSNLTSERPIGLGRCGVRVANSPTLSPQSRGGRTKLFTCALLRDHTQAPRQRALTLPDLFSRFSTATAKRPVTPVSRKPCP